MYTQVVLLLCVLQSLSSYTVVEVELKNGTEVSQVKELNNDTLEKFSAELKVQEPTLREIIFVVDRYLDKKEDEDSSIKKGKPPKSPIWMDESIRPFTNGHGYQFANWELIDKHHEGDEVGDSTDTESDSGQSDNDGGYDDYGGADKHDETNEVTGTPAIMPRHLDVDMVKEFRNKMFDRMKEMYPSVKRNAVEPNDKARRKRQINYQNVPGALTQHNLDTQVIPDYMHRILSNRPTLENSNTHNSPVLRDDYGNILYDSTNTMFSGGSHFGVPRTYGMNLKNDQGYSWNHINHMQNEPVYNQFINQEVQQRPIETHTVKNNPYSQIIPYHAPDVEIQNVKQIPTSEINDINNKHKLNQASNYELPSKVPQQNVTQTIDRETVINNGERNSNVRNKEEMTKKVNQISKRIGKIKNKVKDRFSNKNNILISPEENKLLTFETSTLDNTENILNDSACPQVLINDLKPPNSSNDSLFDNNLKITANNKSSENSAVDAKRTEIHNIVKEANTNKSLIESIEYSDIEINTAMVKPVEDTVNSNTENQNHKEYKQYELNNKERLDSLTDDENTAAIPETENSVIVTSKNSTILDESMRIEKDKESTIVPLTMESVNETTVAEIRENTYSELIEKSDTETSNITLTTETDNESEELYNNKEKQNTRTAHNKDNENTVKLNFDELFYMDEFWDWLSKWTSSYMEILNENIQVLVKDEVAKQMEEIHLKNCEESHGITKHTRRR